jgi:YesN/AraC family two-component response regulator
LSLKRFAEELFLNASYLSALFKKEVGMTLTDYVNQSRLTYAKKLLKSTQLAVQDVATRSGFSDIHYFTRLFRRENNLSPREWRMSQQT